MREAESNYKLFALLKGGVISSRLKVCLQRDQPADDPSCSSLGRLHLKEIFLCCGLYLASPHFLPIYTENIFYALWISYH